MVKGEIRGFALPLVLLLLLALTAFGHGALLLSMRELQATWTFRNLIRAGQAAEIGLHLGMDIPPGPEEDRSPWAAHTLVSGETESGLTYHVTRRWLDGEFFLLDAVGGVRGWAGRKKVGWVGWSLYPSVRLKVFLSGSNQDVALVQEQGAVFSTEEFLQAPGSWPSYVCDPYRELLDSLFAEGRASPLFPWPESAPVDGPSLPPTLGLLSSPELLRRGGTYQPGDGGPKVGVMEGGCPDADEGPLLRVTPGDLELRDRRLCGLVVTRGDFILSGATVFQGLALVGGDLLLRDQTVFVGMAGVRGMTVLRPGSTFRAAGCPAMRALAESPALRKPVRFRQRLPLSAF